MEVLALIIVLIVGAFGFLLGIDWLIWMGWEWVTPVTWHVTNFWQFFVILILIGAAVSWLKSIFVPTKVED